MDENTGPPCRRCVEKNLGCVLNKNLQTLISERSQSTMAMVHDLEMMHTSLQNVLKAMDLPVLSTLRSSKCLLQTSSHEEAGLFRDNSPEISLECDQDGDQELPKVPIDSVYHLTKLSALHSPAEREAGPSKPPVKQVDDLVARGNLSLEDAQRLFRLYIDHLDFFMYRIGGRYETLDVLRRSSRLLTACVLTVSALHDPESNAIYGVCNEEFRRLFAASIFKRQIDSDYLRAMCIASYWLSDISWVVSGCAVRRAAEFNLTGHYRKAVNEGNEDSADYVRLWYVLHICDQHSSMLYGRQPVIREDYTIQGWKAFIDKSHPASALEDTRLASQVALVNITQRVRDLFGPDLGDPVPQIYAMQIANFAHELDQWVRHWSAIVTDHHNQIGGFPRKGVLLHFHFAKLHLYSHVFRGLRNECIPSHFLEAASSAVSAATSIINLLITDPDIRSALAGMPSYIHSMTGFACMFLAKLAMIYGGSLIEKSIVIDLISTLVVLYRSTPVGDWHLIHLMAGGLKTVVDRLQSPAISQIRESAFLTGTGEENGSNIPDQPSVNDISLNWDFDFLLDSNMSLGAPELMYLSTGLNVFETTDNLSPTIL
ncbi:hypothetical protein M406DRAFT_266603 [Cryphonectria parasitica EP155]|uniref:Transcription factor domain-containing protein n=1 Tax=Cryphonectria parasitica (strain ATCC 38755 / EP155) TaxID=660469 RepID=A0A9P5CK91_CRYP1|nr:uncharacterized protein M406DRAFT_266603 [Cryphonectria parasitica EP155]KAF3762034.1 hypothetical protein M406DRAFT_266603 [Cryphonectria parasitica EP155]